MSRFSTFFLISLLALLSALMVSCGISGKQYYVLTPAGSPPSGGGLGIGVGPVSIPAYLERSNLVFKEGGNRLAVSESHHWAGDLENNVASVIAANLGRRLGTGNFRTYPWGSDKELRYQISVDIRQFHGTSAGDAYLDASWRVYSLPDRRMVVSRSWSGTEPLRHDGYEELAAAESRLLDRLAAEMAKGL
jgi:uncharacterized lipoprotein YmbA